MHVSSSPAIWYAARASGVAAYVVLSVVVSFGLALGGKAQSRRWPRFAVEDIHRFGGLLVGSLVGVHVLAIKRRDPLTGRMVTEMAGPASRLATGDDLVVIGTSHGLSQFMAMLATGIENASS